MNTSALKQHQPIITLTRMASTDEGTPGVIVSHDGLLRLFSLELPWRDNRTQLSCIPIGLYRCLPFNSPHLGQVYSVESVARRTSIRIHSANYAGDTTRGYRSDLLGCIAPCLRHGRDKRQLMGLDSKIAMARLKNFLNYQPFVLEIR